jgi:peptidoglycan/LPS O-acetylase OafA/YrhL
VLDLVTSKNRLAVTIAVIPFFVIYLYIINFVIDSLGDSYYIWIFNALLTSFLGGVAIINYINTPGKKEYWLLVSAIFFIIQIGAFFINKFYVKNEAVYQLVILLYGVSHFTFYQFLILKENEGNTEKKIPTL